MKYQCDFCGRPSNDKVCAVCWKMLKDDGDAREKQKKDPK